MSCFFQGQKENQKVVPQWHIAMEKVVPDHLTMNFGFTEIKTCPTVHKRNPNPNK